MRALFAAAGTTPGDWSAWTPIEVESFDFEGIPDPVDGWHFELSTLASQSMTLEFALTRRDARRLRKAFPYSPAELRRSARWSEYRRRQKRRNR